MAPILFFNIFRYRFTELRILSAHPYYLTVLIEEAVLRVTGADYLLVGVLHFISYAKPDTVKGLNVYSDAYFIREGGAASVLALNCGYGRHNSFFLHSVVGPADVAKEVPSRFFHPTDVVGVVSDGHLVRFIILNSVFIIFHKFLFYTVFARNTIAKETA